VIFHSFNKEVCFLNDKDNGGNTMGKKKQRLRDGTGSYEGSYQSEVSDKGKRQEKGEECPFIKKEGIKINKW